MDIQSIIDKYHTPNNYNGVMKRYEICESDVKKIIEEVLNFDVSNISYDEFSRALEVVERYKYQMKPKTKQVSVVYDAEISVTFNVPDKLTIDEIESSVKYGWYDYSRTLQDEPNTEIKEIKELIVNGDIIKI